MATSTYDVVAVGNAIIDIIKTVPNSFLAEENIAKDAMTLIDEARADHLTARLDGAIVAAGGSAANTVTGVASFGGKAGYIGKVADDELGARFTTRVPRCRRRFRHAAAARAARHRAFADRRDAGRPSLDEHLSRRVNAAQQPRTSTPSSSATAKHCSSKAICSTATKRRPRSCAPRRLRAPPGAKSRSRFRTSSASIVTATASAIWWPATSTFCSPTKPRSSRSTRATILAPRSRARARHARSSP